MKGPYDTSNKLAGIYGRPEQEVKRKRGKTTAEVNEQQDQSPQHLKSS